MGRDRLAVKPLSRVARLAPVGLLAVFFLYPLVTILATGVFGADADPLAFVGSQRFRKVLWFTTWQAVVSTLLTLAVALPAAWAVANRRFLGRTALVALVTIPFVLPTVVVAAGFRALIELVGAEGTVLDVGESVVPLLAAHVFFNAAVVVRTVGAAWGNIDPHTAEQARMLGCSASQAFRRVVVPQLVPSIISASMVVFLFSFTSFGTVLLLAGPRRSTLDTEIWRYATQRGELDAAAVLAIIQLATVGLMLLGIARLNSRFGVSAAAGRRRDVSAHSRRGRLVLAAAVAPVLAVTVPPVVALIARSMTVDGSFSLQSFTDLVGEPDRFSPLTDSGLVAVGNSVWIAGLATLFAVSVGVGAVIVAQHPGWLGKITTAGFLLPLGTSGVLLGLGFVVALDEPPLDLRTSWILIPIAQALVGLPFVMRIISPLVGQIDNRVRESARMLGASQWQAWKAVDWPVLSKGALVGATFAFGVALGEFGATIFVSRPDRLTIPVAIFRLLSRPGELLEGQAMALAVVLMVIVAAAVALSERIGVKT